MKILCAAGIYPPEIGGPATFAAMIKKELPARGHEVRIVTYADARISERGVTTIMRTLPKGLRHIVYFFAVLRHAVWADVVIALDPVSAGLPAMWAARCARKKLVLRVGGDYAWEQGIQRYGVGVLLDDFLSKAWAPPVEHLRRVQSRVARHARMVMVQSKYLASVVEHWGVARDKITIVPNSISLPSLPDRSLARSTLGLGDEYVVVSVGRLVPWKGFEILVEAVKDLPVTLFVIGDGPQRGVLEKKITNTHNVRLTGALPKEQLAQYLAAADIFALNTGYEGFSHQLIEAMSAGLAVATTDAGGNKELVEHEKNALVVKYNDVHAWRETIERLMNDSALRGRLGDNARVTASGYTKERALDIFESALHSL